MAIYTVHEPPAKRRDARRGPERFLFVRDGFYFWAFLLTPFWMLWRGLFLVLVGYVLVAAALNAAMYFAHASSAAVFAATVLLSLLVGLEAGNLRRWTLRRRGWRDLGLVSADNFEGAERRFFDAWDHEGADLGATIPPRPVAPAAMRRGASASDIVGLFPEPGPSR